MAREGTKVEKGGQWKCVVDFDTEASGNGVMKRIVAEDFPKEFTKLIGKDAEEEILQVETFKTPLKKHQLTRLFPYHEFVVFQTKSFYWSIEKLDEGLTFQRSSVKDNVQLKRGRKSRLQETSWKVTIKQPTCRMQNPIKNVYNFVSWLIFTDEIKNTRPDCQAFAKRAYDFIKS